MKRLTFVAVLLAASACGGSSSNAPATSEPATAAPGSVHFDELSHQDQVKYMKEVVQPRMAALFQEHDAQEFASFDCSTCHGSGAAKGEFHMPNPELDVLTAEMVQSPDADHQAITTFMQQKVVPTMAELLGEPMWTPQEPEGLGCATCHTFAQ